MTRNLDAAEATHKHTNREERQNVGMIIVAATNEKSQISVIKSMSKGVISAGAFEPSTPSQTGITTTRYTPSTSYVAERTVLEPSLPIPYDVCKQTYTHVHTYSYVLNPRETKRELESHDSKTPLVRQRRNRVLATHTYTHTVANHFTLKHPF